MSHFLRKQQTTPLRAGGWWYGSTIKGTAVWATINTRYNQAKNGMSTRTVCKNVNAKSHPKQPTTLRVCTSIHVVAGPATGQKQVTTVADYYIVAVVIGVHIKYQVGMVVIRWHSGNTVVSMLSCHKKRAKHRP